MIADIYEYSEKSLVKSLKNVLGESQIIIRGYQGAPEPEFDYLVVTALDSLRLSSVKSYTEIDGDFQEYNITLLRVMVEITGYGQSCYSMMQNALSGLGMTSMVDHLHYQYGLSINELGQTQRNPELRGTEYVQRCTTTIELTTTLYHSRDVDWFDTVQFHGEYKTIDGKVVLEENETVSANDT